VKTFRGAWPLAGLVAGFAGLATSYLVAMAMSIRESPVVAVGELVIRYTPGDVAERAIGLLGFWDKPALLVGIFVVLGVLFAWAGRLARTSWSRALLVFGLLGVLGAAAVALRPGTTVANYFPVAVGFVTWLVGLSVLTEPLRATGTAPADQDAAASTGDTPDGVDEGADPSRRAFLVRAGVLSGLAILAGGAGRLVSRGRRQLEETRRLLKLTGVTEPRIPATAKIGVPGVTPWQTRSDDFYLIHTAIVTPTIEPRDWSLRIHGMVDRELVVTYEDLLDRQRTEAWITLNCVSNRVGGDLVGNAWWGGVRLADLLAEAGVDPNADAVLQTSEDGWNCGTPLAALTDDRDAMLALAMNGLPLPIDHGFPVRTLVPGLYGYVSACKWVVDMEVTRFDRIEAYWTGKGWAEKGPVKIASRIDVPSSGDEVTAGEVTFGGVAWHQHVGIRGAEISLDGGEWQAADVAPGPTDDTWVQWAVTTQVEPGDHLVRVRAIGKDGEVQTGVERDVLPDGATGYHEVDFTAEPA
jgi:DMSO/TMAO reductase YedYZ molybdopterin-dependent catalytic subunit